MFFYSVNEFNLLLLLILKIFGKVCVFKSEFLLLNINIEDYFEEVFFSSKHQSLALRKDSHFFISKNINLLESKVGESNKYFKNYLLQKANLKIDEYLIFLGLAREKPELKVIHNFGTSWVCKKMGVQGILTSPLSGINIVIDFFFRKSLLIIKGFRGVLLSSKTLFSKREIIEGNIKYVVGDIAGFDHANGTGDKDFLWPIHNKLFTSDETLFLLNTDPSHGTQKWIEKHKAKIAFSYRPQIYLSLGKKLDCLSKHFFELIKSVFIVDPFQSIIHEWKINSIFWDSFWKELSPKFYFSSTSTLKTESPQTSVCDKNDVTAVNWAYANNEMLFSEDEQGFQDLTVKGALFSCHKILLWDQKVEELYSKRMFDICPRPEFHTISPLMFGSREVFNWKREEIIKKMEIPFIDEEKFVLTYFEDPVVEKDVERSLLIHRPYDQDLVDLSFTALLEILEKNENVILLFKAKKPGFEKHYKTEDFKKMISHPNCFLVPPHVNQYLPIILADMAISLPISSAIDLADYFGMPSVHYFPTDRGFFTFNNYFSGSILRTPEELLEKVNVDFSRVEAIRERKRKIISSFDTTKLIKKSLN